MKLIIGTQARKKINLLQRSEKRSNGFLIGARIAKFTIISDLLIYGFDDDNLPDLYNSVYRLWGFKLKGIFHRNTDMSFDDHFYEKIIMKINKDDIDCYFCRINCKDRSKREIEKINHIFI